MLNVVHTPESIAATVSANARALRRAGLTAVLSLGNVHIADMPGDQDHHVVHLDVRVPRDLVTTLERGIWCLILYLPASDLGARGIALLDQVEAAVKGVGAGA